MAGARRGFRRAPLSSVSQPISRVLDGSGQARCATAIPLGRRLPGASSNLPGRRIWTSIRRVGACAQSLAPSLFGLAPGGVCRAAGVAAGAVRSYRTVSPLPRPYATRRGGLFSVALSLGSRPPDVIRHRLSMEPGLSSPAAFRLRRERPSGRLTGRDGGARRAVKRRGRFAHRAARRNGAHRPRVASKLCSVARVDSSATPSTRSGRKWRWNAVTDVMAWRSRRCR